MTKYVTKGPRGPKRRAAPTAVDPFDRYDATKPLGSPPAGFKITRADLIRAGFTPGTPSWDAAVEHRKYMGVWSDE